MKSSLHAYTYGRHYQNILTSTQNCWGCIWILLIFFHVLSLVLCSYLLCFCFVLDLLIFFLLILSTLLWTINILFLCKIKHYMSGTGVVLFLTAKTWLESLLYLKPISSFLRRTREDFYFSEFGVYVFIKLKALKNWSVCFHLRANFESAHAAKLRIITHDVIGGTFAIQCKHCVPCLSSRILRTTCQL